MRAPPLLLLLLAASASVIASFAGPAIAQPAPRPNFVVIMTDDQRFDTMPYMPLTVDAIASHGIRFNQAFTTTPLCGPTRTNFLSGGYRAESTGLYDNVDPNGGAQHFNDTTTLATRLQASGYTTALIGKYINGYESMQPPFVPPGWSVWNAALNVAFSPGGTFVSGSSGQTRAPLMRSELISQYGTDYERDRAIEFLDAHQNDPFFLYLALPAPHTPSIPAPQDAGLFPDFLYRGRAYAEPNISDKPQRIQIVVPSFPAAAAAADSLHRDMLRTLQSTDRAVAAIMDRLQQLQLLDNTYVIFLSDNGYLWGEHYLFGKGEAYEESIRVPLIVMAPGVAPRDDDRLVATDLDLPAMIQDLAGIPVLGQGTSLVPFLTDTDTPIRQESVIWYPKQWEVWTALRTRDASGDWKYVDASRSIAELYNLAADPFEENNLAALPAYAGIRNAMASRLAASRGLSIVTHFLGAARVGQAFSLTLQRWGGVPPVTWSIVSGALPAGLSLNPTTGVISGVPLHSGPSPVTIRATDSSTGLQSGGPQRYDEAYSNFNVLGECGDTFDNDGDHLVDLADPGCDSASDPSEKSPALPCDDGLDNDGDGIIDLADPGCASLMDPSEYGNTTCDDGADNDGDGLVDLADPGCDFRTDPSEKSATLVCDDDIDNDGDELVDLADPDCDSPSDNNEASIAACGDGFDNDGDGLVDLDDPGCDSLSDSSEKIESLPCDDGLDDDDDGLVDLADPGCASPADPSEYGNAACDDGGDNDEDGLADHADPGCDSPSDSSEQSAALPCDDGLDNDGDGLVDLADRGCDSPSDSSEQSAALPCDDGLDNDGDGLVDLADRGCILSTSPTERPACDDGLDNDQDGKIDFADPQCLPTRVSSESPPAGCGLGAELALVLAALDQRRRVGRARLSRAAPAPSPTRRAASRCD